jgi:hypothetical protein
MTIKKRKGDLLERLKLNRQFPKSGFVNTSLSVDRIYVKSVGD